MSGEEADKAQRVSRRIATGSRIAGIDSGIGGAAAVGISSGNHALCCVVDHTSRFGARSKQGEILFELM